MKRRTTKRPVRNRLRIVAGQWRGRRIEFPDSAGLRPTPDRVRETLFNWLQPWITGAHCLDLYAGSGALGFEAASRGAARVVLVEQDPAVADGLHKTRALLDAVGTEIVCMDVLHYLDAAQGQFDIVFLDPPYGQGLLAPSCARFAQGDWVKPGGLVYLESEPGLDPTPPLQPPDWAAFRNGRAGRVSYHLLRHG